MVETENIFSHITIRSTSINRSKNFYFNISNKLLGKSRNDQQTQPELRVLMIILYFRCLRIQKCLFQKQDHLVGVIPLYFLHRLLVFLVQVLFITHKFVLVKKLEVDTFSIQYFYDSILISLDLFLENPFYQEALILTSGYKPITEKLVEPIQPLQIDPTSKFNAFSLLGAQVSLSFQLIFILFFYYQINLRLIAPTQLKVQRTESFLHSR